MGRRWRVTRTYITPMGLLNLMNPHPIARLADPYVEASDYRFRRFARLVQITDNLFNAFNPPMACGFVHSELSEVGG